MHRVRCKMSDIPWPNTEFSPIFFHRFLHIIYQHANLLDIIRALNEGWEPDWSNWDKWKYYNWFYVEKGGDQRSSGFRYYDTHCTATGTSTGSRLCFKNIELAKYAAEQFKELYREYLLIF